MRFLDCDLTGKQILLCGNYGDPIYHPELFELISKLKQRGSSIRLVTNGSYRSVEWWEQLLTVFDSTDTVVFSVDGIPENFTRYRINADWESIHQAMLTCAKSPATTVWKYIVFNYNENDTESARLLSQQIGIDTFQVEKSARFDDETEHFKPKEEFLNSIYVNQQKWKNNGTTFELQPQCADGNHHFISAIGHYVPCCFLHDYRFYYKTPFGKNKSSYKIADTTLSQILDQPATVEFYNNLSQQPGCQFNCSKIS